MVVFWCACAFLMSVDAWLALNTGTAFVEGVVELWRKSVEDCFRSEGHNKSLVSSSAI